MMPIEHQPALFADMAIAPVAVTAPPSLYKGDKPLNGWPFGDLPMFGFDLLMADNPWHFELYSERGNAKSAQAQYPTMSIAAMKALPVGQLAAGDAILFMWATWPMLREAFEVMAAWGFRYVTGGAWAKMTKNGKTHFGTGYRVRNACDPFLIGVIGRPDTSKAERNLIKGSVRGHSVKPENAYRWCERYLPGARRVDLFAPEGLPRPGWSRWGDPRYQRDRSGKR